MVKALSKQVGRPTRYNKSILEKANSYISGEYEKEEVIPTIAGLSLHLDISRDTVYDWSSQDDKREFSDIVSKLMAWQEVKLTNGGITGNFNASITKLMLTKHGYTDKQEQNVVSDISITVSPDDESVL